MLVPYVGITGFMSRAEVDHVLGNMAIGSSRVLMTGVLASQKTLNGREPGQPGRYPAIHEIEGIFSEHPRSLNLIHYNTREVGSLYEQLDRLCSWGGRWHNGFQLNIKWPPLTHLRELMRQRPETINVLQLGRSAMEDEDNDPIAIARRASGYAGLVRYVLIDQSGGKGEPLRTDQCRKLLRELYRLMPETQMGVAGGLCGPTVQTRIGPLADEFPALCTDAEGRLRTEDDKLMLSEADDYVRETLELFAYRPQ